MWYLLDPLRVDMSNYLLLERCVIVDNLSSERGCFLLHDYRPWRVLPAVYVCWEAKLDGLNMQSCATMEGKLFAGWQDNEYGSLSTEDGGHLRYSGFHFELRIEGRISVQLLEKDAGFVI